MRVECGENEMLVTVIKGTAVKFENDIYGIIMYVYHADKNHKDKSFYKYIGLTLSKQDWQNRINQLNSKPLEAWKLPNLPGLPQNWVLMYDHENIAEKGAHYLELRLKKALDWEHFSNLVYKGEKIYKNKIKVIPSAKYETDGYQIVGSENETIDFSKKENFTENIGKYFVKNILLKRV